MMIIYFFKNTVRCARVVQGLCNLLTFTMAMLMFILFSSYFVQLRIAKVKTTFCLCENSTSLIPQISIIH